MTSFVNHSTLIRKLATTAVLIGSMLLSSAALGQTSNAPGSAQITSVGPISPKAWQTIVITGAHFGKNPPVNGCPDHMRVTDVTTNWSVPAVGPFGGCQAGIFVSSWNDTEIVIEGFPSFPRGQDAFKIGDVIKIEVSNAQQGGPASWYSVRVSPEAARVPASTAAAPVSTQSSEPAAPRTAQIASVSPISPKGWQTIVIKGSNFGRNPPINGCPDHMRVTDVTTNWSVPAVGPFGGCQAGIFISLWNDNEIVIEGFSSFQRGQDAFKIGDVIKIEVSNAQQGGPAAWFSLRVTPNDSPTKPVLQRVPASIQEFPPTAPMTIPSGTKIVIRMIDSVDSSKNKAGDTFQASLESDVVVTGAVVAPKGADVYGKIAQAKSAGKIHGGAELKLEMTGIRIKGNIVPVESTHYDEVGKGRGKQSAESIAGGAAAGSAIGAIARGASAIPIGGGAGAAAGAIALLATHAKQIRIPSETVLEFELEQPLTLPSVVASVGTSEGASPPVEVGSSSAPMASSSNDDTASPSTEETSSVELGSSSAPVASSSTGDIVSASAESNSDTHSNSGDAATVTAANQCIIGGAGIKKGPGTVRIESGTDAFSEVSPSNKVITVSPGSEVQGKVTLGVLNQGPGFAVAPLIQTPSWGEHQSSWKLITNLRPGESTITAQVKERAPLQTGTYYIFFTFALELSGANVASGTNWARHADVWNDGNDISELKLSRAQEAQQFGCTVARWLMTDGFELLYLPADAIRVYVGSDPTHDSAPEPMPSATGPSIAQAVIRGGATALELPQGKMYLYGMTTGGAKPSSGFTDAPYAQVVNAAGNVSVALAYGTNSQNTYSAQTAYHDIGGVSVAGSWEHFAAYYGSNRQSGAHDASVSFEANEDSLVVVLGLASSQQFVSVEGIPKLQVDASKGGIVIAHASVKPGNYTIVERSKALAAGQGPGNMADLVGVFVFGSRQVNSQPAVASSQTNGGGNAAATVEDDFASDHSLNQSIWTTHGEALNARILKADTRFVPVRLAFSDRGMVMAGVDAKFQSTGIQSTRSFSTPLTLEAKVMGTISNGNPFALYLVNADGGQYLTLNGHLDRGNGGDYSLGLGYTGLGKNAGNTERRELSRAVSLHAWNVIRITIDAGGMGTVVVEDLQGSRLATENNLTVGTGPFFVVLAQWEGWPHTIGPNEAVWGKVTISTASPEAISMQPVEAGPGAEKGVNQVIDQRTGSASSQPRDGQAVKTGIRSVDFRNFEYHPDCLQETVRVSKGEWKEVKEDEQNSFRIVSVNYGDLKGDGQDEAVVWGACGGVGNFEINDIIIFSASPGGPMPVAELSPSDWGKGEEGNGSDFQVTGIRVGKQQLAVSFWAGGSHACADWVVTSRFQWKGTGFVRAGVTRQRNNCQAR